MKIAIAVAATFGVSAVVAFASVFALYKYSKRQGITRLGVAGTVLTVATITVQIAVPALHGMGANSWQRVWIDYFLALTHLFLKGPYPFLWSPPWAYTVGLITPLVFVGGSLAVVAGMLARERGPFRLAQVGIGAISIGVYLYAASVAAIATWNGVLLA